MVLAPLAGLLMAFLLSCGSGSEVAVPAQPTAARPGTSFPPAAGEPPRLALLIVIDQARGDMLDRFRPLLSGGLRRLLDDGIHFTEASQGHADTLTGPGHASLATGLEPARHGIIANSWLDVRTGEKVYCVADRSLGRSPRNLRRDTLGDWLKARWPGSRVFAASGKDRAAILLGGRLADGAYWYDRSTGRFTSSHYYRLGSPDWLRAFNRLRIPDKFFGQAWEPVPVPADPAGSGIEEPDQGDFHDSLPRALGWARMVPDEAFYDDFYSSPFLDAYLAQLAAEIILQEGLGADESPDLLALGFSALDPVGHDYGPDSPEALDVVLRLDQALGELLDLLDREVGSGRYVVALSSDHGVPHLPESTTGAEDGIRRLSTDDVLCLQRAGRRLEQRLGPGDWLWGDGYLNRDLVAEHGLTLDDAARELADVLEECSAVRHAWTRAELESGATRSDPSHALFVAGHDPARSPDVTVQLEPGLLPRWPRGTTHGSPYRDDTHVPLLLSVPGRAPARVDEPVRTVDLAPTLAGLLGVPVPDDLDGRDLTALMPPGPAAGSITSPPPAKEGAKP